MALRQEFNDDVDGGAIGRVVHLALPVTFGATISTRFSPSGDEGFELAIRDRRFRRRRALVDRDKQYPASCQGLAV